MLALAIEFSRCARARTLKAEQCVPPATCPTLVVRLASETTEPRDLDVSNGRPVPSTWSRPAEPNVMSDRRECQRLLRKEVIQPHLPVRLPCYDFTPIASPTFDGSLHKG